jgi:hypothetical protein
MGGGNFKTNTMKTAMQIAVESYKNDGVSFTEWFMDNYEMLLEKEKEQIIYAGNKCQIYNDGFVYEDGEEYYNQTYNQNK